MSIPPLPPLRIRDADGSPNVIPVFDIVVSNMTLTKIGGTTVRLDASGSQGPAGPAGTLTIGSGITGGAIGGYALIVSDGATLWQVETGQFLKVYAPTGGNYIAFAADGNLSAEKVLQASNGTILVTTDATGVYLAALTGVTVPVYAPTGGNYVAFLADANLSNEKVLTASDNITLTTSATAIFISATTNQAGSSVVYAPTGGPYVTFIADATLTDERILSAGTNVTITTSATAIFISADTGAGGGAPSTAEYVTYAANGSLSAEKVLTAGSSVTIVTDATAIYINAVTNAAGAAATKTVRIPMALLTVAVNSANAWYEARSGANIDAAHTVFSDNCTGRATYWTEVPYNVVGTGSWRLIFKHEAERGSGGVVVLTMRATVSSDGNTVDAAPTVLLSTNQYTVNTFNALSVTTSSTALDSTLALTAGALLRVVVERSGGNANDTVNANWYLKSLNLQCDVS